MSRERYSPGRRPRAPILVALVALGALCACAGDRSGSGGKPAADAVAEIGGSPVARAAFEAYVADVLQADPGETSEPPAPELLSRLLDRFLDEELIMWEAGVRGISVSEREITEALRRLSGPEEAKASMSPEGQGEVRERMRRSLVARKFREEVVLKDLSVSDEEIAAHYQAHRDEFHQAARVVLRQIMLDDPEEARKVREELAGDPARFQEIAETRSLAPDGGRPRAYEEADLPPEVLEATASVPVGGVSDVVTAPEASRIFLVEQRQAERLVGIDEAKDGIRVTLLQEKGRRAFDAFMKHQREEARLVIHEENLPFPYKKRTA